MVLLPNAAYSEQRLTMEALDQQTASSSCVKSAEAVCSEDSDFEGEVPIEPQPDFQEGACEDPGSSPESEAYEAPEPSHNSEDSIETAIEPSEDSEGTDDHEATPQELRAALLEDSTPLAPLPRGHLPNITPIGVLPFRVCDWELEQRLTEELARALESHQEVISCIDNTTPEKEQSLLVRLGEVLTNCELDANSLPTARFTKDEAVRIWTYCIHLRTRTRGEPREDFPIPELAKENCENEYQRLCHEVAKAMMQNYEVYFENRHQSLPITKYLNWTIETLPENVQEAIYEGARSEERTSAEGEGEAQAQPPADAQFAMNSQEWIDWAYPQFRNVVFGRMGEQ